MEVIDNITDLDQTYKIGLALLGVLIVGFVASSFHGTPLLGADNGYTTYGGQAESYTTSGGLAYDTSIRTEAQRGSTTSGSSEQKIVTTVTTTLKVQDVVRAQEDIRQRVDQYNGFIESSSIDQRNKVSGSMAVAVPDGNLSEFTEGLENSYRVESQSSDRTDVTDQYNELEAELESKKQEMEQLERLMNRSENVSDLVDIQERMSELRSRINFLQKQLEDLDERVTYSRVYITFEGPELLKASFDLKETFFQAYRAIFESIKLMIVGTAYLIPFAVVIGLYKLVKARFRP